MARLAEADYRGTLDVLHEAGAVDGPVAFPESVLEALRRLVPCDVVAYHERPIGNPAVAYAGEPRGEVTSAIRAAEVRYLDQDPLTPADGARKFSDFLTRRAFHRLDFYQEVSRPLGVEDMMRLWLDQDGARLEFDRPDRGFLERDREVLDLLLGHLKQFRRRALARRSRDERSAATRALTPREREIVALVARGMTNADVARTLWLSPGTVRKHLENAYSKLGVHTRAAAVAALLSDGRFD